MRNDAYEKAYCDAREVLYNRGKKVGGPQRAVGVRYCPVDGLPLTDRELLLEAWGADLADEILREWAETDSLNCPDCDRLWQQYLTAAKDYVQILRQQQVPAIVEESIALANAAKRRHNTRQCVRDHAARHVAEPVLERMH